MIYFYLTGVIVTYGMCFADCRYMYTFHEGDYLDDVFLCLLTSCFSFAGLLVAILATKSAGRTFHMGFKLI